MIPETTSGTETSRNSSSFQLGSAGIAVIAVVAVGLLFGAIAIFVIRRKNNKKEFNDSIINLEEMTLQSTKNPSTAVPGSKAIPLIPALSSHTLGRRPDSPSRNFFYGNTDNGYSNQTLDHHQHMEQTQFTQQQIDQWNAQTVAGICKK